MNAPVRKFEAKPAARDSVPLLIGLMGASGSGKTFSALRLASGIQSVVGGDIYGIDTEARRMLHYAEDFKFKHVQFDPPFGSLDYLAALRQCVAAGAKVIIVDSMSHEHESEGGMIDLHDKELDRIAGNDWSKRERVKMLAWQKPKSARRQLINGLLQLNANFIFCFRAKQTVKPMKVSGKTEIVPQGFMPIAGDEFLFEQTVNCLLLPKSGGVPSWQSENIGERQMMKLPRQFEHAFSAGRALDEETGRALAQWAQGGSAKQASRTVSAARRAEDPSPGEGLEQDREHEVVKPGDGDGFHPAPTAEEYSGMWDSMLAEATDPEQIKSAWQAGKELRNRILWPEDEADKHHWVQIMERAKAKRAELTKRSGATHDQ